MVGVSAYVSGDTKIRKQTHFGWITVTVSELSIGDVIEDHNGTSTKITSWFYIAPQERGRFCDIDRIRLGRNQMVSIDNRSFDYPNCKDIIYAYGVYSPVTSSRSFAVWNYEETTSLTVHCFSGIGYPRQVEPIFNFLESKFIVIDDVHPLAKISQIVGFFLILVLSLATLAIVL